MKLIIRKMPRHYTVVLNACNHFGAKTCDKQAIQTMVRRVAEDPECFYLNLGDNIDGITPGDKRCKITDIDTELNTPHRQARAVVETFYPMRDRILAIGSGNHEEKLKNTADFGESIAHQLGVPYGTFSYKFIALDAYENILHKFYLTHGAGTLAKGTGDALEREVAANRSLKKRLLTSQHADCVLMGMAHTHRALVKEPTLHRERYLVDDGETLLPYARRWAEQDADFIPEDARFYVCVPSMMNLYTALSSNEVPYGELATYAPPELGWIEVRVESGKVVAAKKVLINA